jgi:hypothetical protein
MSRRGTRSGSLRCRPQAWPATYNLDIPFERGDNVRGLQPMGDALIVFGSTGIYISSGTSQDFEGAPRPAPWRARSPRRAAAGERVLHASVGGVYLFDGRPTGWQRRINRAGRRWSTVRPLTCCAPGHRLPRTAEGGAVGTPGTRTPGPGEWVLDLERSKVQKRGMDLPTGTSGATSVGRLRANLGPGPPVSWPLDPRSSTEAWAQRQRQQPGVLYRSPALLVCRAG